MTGAITVILHRAIDIVELKRGRMVCDIAFDAKSKEHSNETRNLNNRCSAAEWRRASRPQPDVVFAASAAFTSG